MGGTLVGVSQLLTAAQLRVQSANDEARMANMKLEVAERFTRIDRRFDAAEASSIKRFYLLEASISALSERIDRIQNKK